MQVKCPHCDAEWDEPMTIRDPAEDFVHELEQERFQKNLLSGSAVLRKAISQKHPDKIDLIMHTLADICQYLGNETPK